MSRYARWRSEELCMRSGLKIWLEYSVDQTNMNNIDVLFEGRFSGSFVCCIEVRKAVHIENSRILFTYSGWIWWKSLAARVIVDMEWRDELLKTQDEQH